VARFLVAANRGLIGPLRSLFAYQIFMVARPRRSLELLLQTAQRQSAMTANAAVPNDSPTPMSAQAPERQLGR
jgi:hypothetical protein